MKKLVFPGLLALIVLQISACASSEAKEEIHLEASPAEAVSGNVVALTPAQLASIDLRTGGMETKAMANAIKANGMVAVPNHNKAFVTPMTNGVIKQLFVHHGHTVRKGQALAVISNPALLQQQQALQGVRSQISLAKTEQERLKTLVAGNAAPLKRLQENEAQLRQLQSEQASLQQQLNLVGAGSRFGSSVTIKAPISGIISQMNTQLGSNVSVDMPIAEIVNNEDLHVELAVYEKDMAALKVGQVIRFTLTNLPGRTFDARIFGTGMAVDPQTRTVPIHAEVISENTGLIDGLNVTALISLGSQTVQALPSEAVVQHGGRDYVFVAAGSKEGKQLYRRVLVAAGKSDLGYTQVTTLEDAGAQPQFVVKGAYYLMAMMTNSGEE